MRDRQKITVALHKLRGIGLLELILVLSVLAVAILMSVQYYSSANAKQGASSLVTSYNTMRTATQNYLADHPGAAFPSIADLVTQGYLPSAYGTVTSAGTVPGKNQWGGSIALTDNKDGTFSVTQTRIPDSVCGMVQQQLASTVNAALNEKVVIKSADQADQKAVAAVCGDEATITVIYNQ
jgi:type II secretory pathway pseudopilin PulG